MEPEKIWVVFHFKDDQDIWKTETLPKQMNPFFYMDWKSIYL